MSGENDPPILYTQIHYRLPDTKDKSRWRELGG